LNSSFPVYCDHDHLYSFYYEAILSTSDADSDTDLDVWGWTMTGFPGMCTYYDFLAIDVPIKEGKDVKV